MTTNPTPEKSLSHNEKLLAGLQAGKSYTPMDALNEIGTWALSSRISDLRKQGHNIKSELITLENGKKVSRYWMEPTPMILNEASLNEAAQFIIDNSPIPKPIEKPLNELFV